MSLEAELHRHFGFGSFRPLQREIIEAVLSGRQVAGILPTGSGKSLCYQLPAVLLPGLTVVISPLISLMKDQVDSLLQRGISAFAITSHDTAEEGRAKLGALSRGEVKLLFVAPERLQNQAFLAALRSSQAPVSLLVVDEAHCVSQWGHDFRPEYRQIPEFHRAVGEPPMLALTATARPSVQSDLVQQLGIPEAAVFKASADRPNLWIGVDRCEGEAEREAKLLHLIGQAEGSVILYVTSRKEAERWADVLSSASERVLCYHGGMSPDERTAVQNQFMTDQVRVVVATNAFGMGIDKPDIRLVLHAGVPESLEGYYQEIGRAGRDGEPAECRMVLVPGRDVKVREHLLSQSGTDEIATERFRQMRIFVYLKDQCRRTYVLRYFGERLGARPEACCDVCNPRVVTVEPIARRARGSRRTRASRGAAVTAAPVAAVAHPLQAVIFERLRLWRRGVASERGVPPFVIFGDRDLEGVAAAAPRTLAELSACRGIGPTKLREYGEALLAEVGAGVAAAGSAPVANPASGSATPLGEAPAERAAEPQEPARAPRERGRSREVATGHFAAGRTVEETAAAMGLAPSTVHGYFVEWVASDPTEAWKQAVRQVLTPDAYREIRAAWSAQEDGRLKPVYERLDGRYSYDQIRVAKAVLDRTR